MQVYAVQVELVDAGIGRLVDTLDETRCAEDTLVIFLSDNGASPEDLLLVELERFQQRTDIVRQATCDGRSVTIGNDPEVSPGGEDASYGQAWPLHRLLARWRGGSVVHQPFQLTDVLPTSLEVTGAEYPQT